MSVLRPTRVRYWMLLLVFVGTVVNCLDRANLAVAAPLMKNEFGLGPVELGFIFSACSWTYMIANIPGGWVVDRFGSRVMYACAIFIWSAFTFAQGFVGRFATLFGLRLGVGVAEAPTFPVNNRVVSIWFAQRERGFATSVYLIGQYVGMAALTPFLFWIAHRFGWREIFLFTGALGMACALTWYPMYRDPEYSKQSMQPNSNISAAAVRRSTARARRSSIARFRGASSACCFATGRSSRSARASSPRSRRCICFGRGFRPTSSPSVT